MVPHPRQKLMLWPMLLEDRSSDMEPLDVRAAILRAHRGCCRRIPSKSLRTPASQGGVLLDKAVSRWNSAIA